MKKQAGASLDSASSPAAEASQKADDKGGIDLRALPIVIQAISNLSANLRDSPLRGQSLRLVNLDSEWRQIENLVNAGIRPSAERIKEYIQASCYKDDLGPEMDKVISCISDVLRLEEEQCCATDQVLKDILIVLESGQSAQELKGVFLGAKS